MFRFFLISLFNLNKSFQGLINRVFNDFIYSKTSEYNSIFQFIVWQINGQNFKSNFFQSNLFVLDLQAL